MVLLLLDAESGTYAFYFLLEDRSRAFGPATAHGGKHCNCKSCCADNCGRTLLMIILTPEKLIINISVDLAIEAQSD